MNFSGSDDCNLVLDTNPGSTIGKLWIGNFKPSDDINFLKQNKINFVVTAMPKICASKPIYAECGISQMIADTEDTPGCNISVYFENAYNFIENGLQNGNVLSHCGAGISRSTTMALAWYIKKHKATFNQGLELFRKKRPICTPNSGFTAQLKEWERQCL